MAASRPVRKYNVTQAKLYAICDVGWNSCSGYLADFAAYKTFYTPAYVTAAMDAIKAASLLPEQDTRDERHKLLHTELLMAAEECSQKWRELRGYIESALPAPKVKAVIDSAGMREYKLSENSNWPATEIMMTSGKNVIDKYLAELTAPGGMTAGFPAEFEGARTAFKMLYQDFKGAQQDSREMTNEKINANNAIYTDLQAMFADGRCIFGKNAGVYNRFVFERVKRLVTTQRDAEEEEMKEAA